ncbi:uncharacterized protein LOC131845855 [Achroia grisella]|uniref:uncharacterized protein LOC131845855 n=1 Tax=Achroia grisella TaxID=688607 RepID=UPI0027D2A302|nr:uncharacterized protein LOC131845855 [Achroia grisella]
MKKIVFVCTLFVFLYKFHVYCLNIPGPLVYVVTPSSPLAGANEGRSAPFYYHNWIKRMDSPQNMSTTTTSKPKVKTPDLIFAEFESDSSDNMRKSIRKLLEKERIEAKSSTTMGSIYVPDDVITKSTHKFYEAITENIEETSQPTNNDNFNLYTDSPPAPVYIRPITESSTITTIATPVDVKNIWHVIDSEKYNQYSGQWNEIPITSEVNKDITLNSNKVINQDNEEDIAIDENFALPGFGTNPGNGAENESRAIRTEPNIRFPYVSLKPFQIKNPKNPLPNTLPTSKKGNGMYTNLDNFQEIRNPVRGEVEDVNSIRQPIERYNPAQPYLPHDYGSKSKQSKPISTPTKTVANLVPPPPPAPPKLTADDFPSPTNYESFPPYALSAPDPVPMVSSPPVKPPSVLYPPPVDMSSDSGFDSPPTDSDKDEMPMDLGYQYNSPPFVPTNPPVKKPFDPYDKPPMVITTPPTNIAGGYSYNKPAMSYNSPPVMNMGGYTYNKPEPTMNSIPDDKPDFHGYHYNKPAPAPTPEVHSPLPTYGHHDPSPYHYEPDYPELIYDKPYGSMDDSKIGNDTKGGDDTKYLGMMPPPPQPSQDMDMNSDMNTDDNGFPHDFPGYFKYHDDDHGFYHHHHHHTTTTTTTTEMPRVNRYSYYYLGKKLYYLPLYFSVYFIIYVGALIIKAILRHKIVYPNSWRPNDSTATFFSKRSVDSWDFSNETLNEVTGRITRALAVAAEKYMTGNTKNR